MTRRSLAAPLVAVALLTGPAPAGPTPRTVSVTGQGKAAAVPDMATVRTGVTTEAPSAEKALAANNEAMRKVLAILKGHQIDPNDVQTARLSVRPVPRRDRDGRALNQVAGYEGTNQVRVTVRDLSRLGTVLDALVQAGSNQLSGVSLQVADPTQALDRARARAVADARRRARLYAQEAGARLGKVLTIDEQPGAQPLAQRSARADLGGEAASAVPVAVGQDELRASVRMTFALKGAPPRAGRPDRKSKR